MRYRQGALSTTEADDKVIKSWITPVSVAKIREECTRNPECITFSYYSETTRFPTSKVDWAYLYPYADFHVREDEWPSFVEGMEWDGWHTYVNITREKDLVIQEVTTIVERLNSIGMRKNEENKEDTKDSNANETEGGSRLRGGSSSGSRSQKDEEEVEEEDASELDEDDERKLRLLSFLFDIIYRKEHKLIAAPHIIAYMLKLATSSEEIDDVRVNAMKVLIVVADTPETGPILVEHGVYTEMKRMVDEREGWDVISITALDVISNMIIYRSANAMLRHLDAHTFLRKLLSESGFVGLQATLALSHLDDVSLEAPSLPGQNLEALIKLLQSAVEQDVVYDILWDLIPGPLSSVKHIVEGSNDAVRNTLLDAGLMEELLKILEDSGDRKAEDIVCTLEVALMLARTSERARHMVLLAEHTVQEAEERLLKFERAAKLAGGLLEAAATGGRGAEL
eukprot:CAMPEP_0197734038 /NCGR_PEP_ID=MMETSP1434-20131217/44217_1 /TAXON_ID=265543 /ORGANISM="Minutocellus polymorphus, Strain CCMP3303" /LENGTH=453 /DNA_ID=CAMNT_0043321443 /DNA_START=957 /DNA_END=2318 /DNA_ORIENTATION=-